MNKRKIGNLEVSSIGLGCMGMTHAYGAPSDDGQMIEIIHKAAEFGCTFFDTAECYTGVYSDGTTAYNEELVGKAVKHFRNSIILATKFGVRLSNEGLYTDSHPRTIRQSVEGSLKRLQTDYIDLYYQHRVDTKIPIEEVAGTMRELVEEGKIRFWGMSEADADIIRKAHATYKVTAVQSRYSMIVKGIETEVLPVLEELGIGLVAHGPLGNGLLSGKYDKTSEFDQELDYRSFLPQFAKDKIETNLTLVNFLVEIGKAYNATPAQVSLAWLHAQKSWIVPIPGTRKSDRLIENLGADSISITQDDVSKINAVADKIFSKQ